MSELENKGVSEIKRLCGIYGISPIELSLYLQITWTRIYEILSRRRRITPDTDIRLCHFFNLAYGHFAKLQLEYDLQVSENELADSLEKLPTVDGTVKAL